MVVGARGSYLDSKQPTIREILTLVMGNDFINVFLKLRVLLVIVLSRLFTLSLLHILNLSCLFENKNNLTVNYDSFTVLCTTIPNNN